MVLPLRILPNPISAESLLINCFYQEVLRPRKSLSEAHPMIGERGNPVRVVRKRALCSVTCFQD